MISTINNRSGTIHLLQDFLKETAKNVLMGSSAFRKWRAKRPRAGEYFTGKQSELDRYAFQSLNLLRKYTGSLAGKSICEIGPGDYLTSGLSLLAAGATRYAAIDRFLGDYSSTIARQWYRGIETAWSVAYPELPWPEDLRASDFPENYASRLELITKPIEKVDTASRFDLVCSFQVGEHISDVGVFAAKTYELLNPDGLALHRVDFGPHDSWRPYQDPMTFLRLPDWAWRLQGSNRDVPNRFRHHEFMEAFAQAGLSAEVVAIDGVDEGRIDFSRLHTKFRKMPAESLRINSAIYRLRRIGNQSRS